MWWAISKRNAYLIHPSFTELANGDIEGRCRFTDGTRNTNLICPSQKQAVGQTAKWCALEMECIGMQGLWSVRRIIRSEVNEYPNSKRGLQVENEISCFVLR